jgi:hypothetical protein
MCVAQAIERHTGIFARCVALNKQLAICSSGGSGSEVEVKSL